MTMNIYVKNSVQCSRKNSYSASIQFRLNRLKSNTHTTRNFPALSVNNILSQNFVTINNVLFSQPATEALITVLILKEFVFTFLRIMFRLMPINAHEMKRISAEKLIYV